MASPAIGRSPSHSLNLLPRGSYSPSPDNAHAPSLLLHPALTPHLNDPPGADTMLEDLASSVSTLTLPHPLVSPRVTSSKARIRSIAALTSSFTPHIQSSISDAQLDQTLRPDHWWEKAKRESRTESLGVNLGATSIDRLRRSSGSFRSANASMVSASVSTIKPSFLRPLPQDDEGETRAAGDSGVMDGGEGVGGEGGVGEGGNGTLAGASLGVGVRREGGTTIRPNSYTRHLIEYKDILDNLPASSQNSHTSSHGYIGSIRTRAGSIVPSLLKEAQEELEAEGGFTPPLRGGEAVPRVDELEVEWCWHCGNSHDRHEMELKEVTPPAHPVQGGNIDLMASVPNSIRHGGRDTLVNLSTTTSIPLLLPDVSHGKQWVCKGCS